MTHNALIPICDCFNRLSQNDTDHLGGATAKDVFRFLAAYSPYAFNKAHAVAYAELVYRIAYLKANFGVTFADG